MDKLRWVGIALTLLKEKFRKIRGPAVFFAYKKIVAAFFKMVIWFLSKPKSSQLFAQKAGRMIRSPKHRKAGTWPQTNGS